jgi:hypothetical protein
MSRSATRASVHAFSDFAITSKRLTMAPRAHATMQLMPAENQDSLRLPRPPARCLFDGKTHRRHYAALWHATP